MKKRHTPSTFRDAFFPLSAWVFLFALSSTAQAAEIKVLCANGMQPVIEEIAPIFERASGHKLSLVFATGGEAAKRALAGEAVDIVIAPEAGVQALVKEGKGNAKPESVATIASTGISVAVRTGAPKPDISTPDAFKQALLAAKSITYLNPKDGGASGIHFAKVLDRLGIADAMKSKTIFAPKADAIGPLLAKGEAEIGVLQYQLLFGAKGIDIVGPLPGNLQNTTIFMAAVMSRTGSLDASKAFAKFLSGAEAAAVIKAKGMEAVAP